MRQKKVEKIRLYERRTLTAKVNTVFDFIHENWKPWLRLTVYVLLPLSIIGGMGLVDLMVHHVFHDYGGQWWVSSLKVYGLWSVGYMVSNCLFLTLMKCYFDHSDGLETVTFRDLWRELRGVLLPMLILSALLFAVALPVSLLTVFSLFLLPFVELLYVGCVINPLMLAAPVLVFNREMGLIEAIKQGFRLCLAQFWKMIGMMIVMLLIYFYSQVFFLGVWTILSIVLSTFASGHVDVSTNEVIMTVIYYIATIAMTLVQYYSYSVLIMAVAFHYGSVAQEKDDAGLEMEIANFDGL